MLSLGWSFLRGAPITFKFAARMKNPVSGGLGSGGVEALQVGADDRLPPYVRLLFGLDDRGIGCVAAGPPPMPGGTHSLVIFVGIDKFA